MKRFLLLMTALPFISAAQLDNKMNNPNLPGYQNPSQQRMQQKMQTEQRELSSKLNQQRQIQTRAQQQYLDSQIKPRSSSTPSGGLTPPSQQTQPLTHPPHKNLKP